MKLEVLVSSMHQRDHSLLDKMNINSNAIIINQCDKNKLEKFTYRGNQIKLFSFAERGVGLSRNNALMRATGDICLFADDDVIYEDGYEQMVLKAFVDNPKADVIIFNLQRLNDKRQSHKIIRKKRVRIYNALRYGTVRIAVKTQRIHEKNIYFSLLFGGGAQYSAGEDTLFLCDCFHKGLKIYTSPEQIGVVEQKESTWFAGYNEKFFVDKGVLFHYISKRLARLLCIQFVIRKYKQFSEEMHWSKALRLMNQGINEVRKNV